MTDTSENSFSCDVGFSIQCFTLNSNANKVIVAGRDVIKLYSIEENEFVYKSEHELVRVVRIMVCNYCEVVFNFFTS